MHKFKYISWALILQTFSFTQKYPLIIYFFMILDNSLDYGKRIQRRYFMMPKPSNIVIYSLMGDPQICTSTILETIYRTFRQNWICWHSEMYLFPKHVDGLKGLKNNDDMFAYLSPGHLHVKFNTLYGTHSCPISL